MFILNNFKYHEQSIINFVYFCFMIISEVLVEINGFSMYLSILYGLLLFQPSIYYQWDLLSLGIES